MNGPHCALCDCIHDPDFPHLPSEMGGPNPADLRKLIDLLALQETSNHGAKPLDLKRAIRVVEELSAARDELWNALGITEGVTNAAYRTPESLAEMLHEARAKRDAGLAPWDEQPEDMQAVDVAVAADVIDRLLTG